MQPPPPVPPVAAAAPAQPQPIQQPEDDLKPPGFLQRQPEPQAPPAQPVAPPPPTAAAPGVPPQQEVMPPPAQPTLPPGMVLPPGMTPEMAAAFMAQMQPKATGRGRSGRPRTPPVQPTNMDSSQPQQEAQPAAAQPTMVIPSGPPAAPQANGAAAPDAAVSSIMSTVKNLL
jgi:protein TonB